MSLHAFAKPPLYQTYMEKGSRTILDGIGGGERHEKENNTESIWNWVYATRCRFCTHELTVIDRRGIHGEDADGSFLDASQAVVACLGCGWWRYRFSHGSEVIHLDDVGIGSILRVDDSKFWAPVPIIREFLHTNPSYLRTDINPISLEQLLKDVFSDYFNCEVRWTGRGPDGGFDLYHVLADGGSTLYQIKRRSPSIKSESVVPIRALLGTLIIRNAVAGIYVTTAERFSKAAKNEAAIANEFGYQLQLIDYNRLLDILDSTLPKNCIPWRALWEKHSKAYAHYKKVIKHPIKDL